VFTTSGWGYVGVGVLTLAVGVVIFLIRAKLSATWPFRTVTEA
jgi:hypothetical protein